MAVLGRGAFSYGRGNPVAHLRTVLEEEEGGHSRDLVRMRHVLCLVHCTPMDTPF